MIKCINCYQFGIFEKLEEEVSGIIQGLPQTLDEKLRDYIDKNDFAGFAEALKKYHLYNQHLNCLSRKVENGKKISQEEGFQKINLSESHFSNLCEIALKDRECPGFKPKNPKLPYNIYKKLSEKTSLDQFCDIYNTQLRKQKLEQLKTLLIALETSEETPQIRGKSFEKWLESFLFLYAKNIDMDIVNNYEQIDFTCILENFHIIGEARWTSENTSSKEVRDFFGKLQDRPPFVIGIMITMKGLAKPAKEWLSKHSGDRCVLVIERADLNKMLDQLIELPNWFNYELKERVNHP